MKVSISKLWVSALFLVSSFCANASIVDVQEIRLKNNSDWLNEYIVSNNSELDIFLFGVTNSVQHAVGIDLTRSGWGAVSVSKEEWNSGDINMFNLKSGVMDPATDEGETYLGSFESLFGSLEDYVNLYFVHDFKYEPQYIKAGEQNARGFYFNAPVASEYVAFDINGTLIYKSHMDSVSVPEPTSLILLCLGLAGLVMTRRRKI